MECFEPFIKKLESLGVTYLSITRYETEIHEYPYRYEIVARISTEDGYGYGYGYEHRSLSYFKSKETSLELAFNRLFEKIERE